jgi:cytochrome P450
MTSTTRGLDLNPVSPENLRNPIPLYKELRESDPVHWSDVLQAWLITRYDDLVTYCRDPRLSADRSKYYANQIKGLGEDAAEGFMRFARLQMTMRDGADHLRVRRPAQAAFSQQGIESWLPAIRRITSEILDQVLPLGRMDLVADFSYQLPPLVIAEVLGVPASHHQRFRQWSVALGEFSSPAAGKDMKDVAARGSQGMMELSSFLAKAIEERRHAPGQDVLSQMVHHEGVGKITPEELVANAIAILAAGHLTTTDQINNSIYDLLTHPEQLRMLRENPSLMRQAVEEMVRFTPAVSTVFRVAAETFELRGRTIRKGDVVFFLVGAANRDPEVFRDPDRFDITRDSSQQRQMSFSFGPHQCLGAHLARYELEIAIGALLQHLPGLRLDPDHQPRRKLQNLLFQGFEQLHIRW